MSSTHAVRHVLQVTRRHGLLAAAASTADLLARRLLRLDLYRVLWLKLVPHPVRVLPPGLECRFLSAQEIRAFALEPANDLDAPMADRIERGSDFCFAVLNRGNLAAYSWYARGSVDAEHTPGPPMALPADVAYAYKSFVLPAFRGHRLDGVGRCLALQSLAGSGIRKIMTIVHWTNWPSLRSFRRTGFGDLGFLFSVGPRDWKLSHIPRRAIAEGIEFGSWPGPRDTRAAAATGPDPCAAQSCSPCRSTTSGGWWRRRSG